VSAVLLVAFQGSLSGLAPLFTIGAFLTFTLSQSGMVHYHWKRRERGWHWRLGANATGALTTAVVLLIVLASKFVDGAWLIVVCLPLLVLLLRDLGQHQQRLRAQAAMDPVRAEHFVKAVVQRTHHRVLVPVGGIDRITLHAVAFVESLVGEPTRDGETHEPAVVVEAVHVTDDRQAGVRLQQQWRELGLVIPLVVLESPSRAATPALLEYIEFVQDGAHLRTVVTVALPETAPTRWWHPLMRNYLASGLKLALLSKPGVSVLSVPLALQD
jgi:hypothetical protein